jgi:hypothetical protein
LILSKKPEMSNSSIMIAPTNPLAWLFGCRAGGLGPRRLLMKRCGCRTGWWGLVHSS